MLISDIILEILYTAGDLMPRPFETKYSWAYRMRRMDKKQFNRSVRDLSNRGYVKVFKQKDQKFLQLTKEGQLRVLLKKAKEGQEKKWDGKWRLILFDIPEGHRKERDNFRNLLKSNHFHKLQSSVYINPYPLNRAAIDYLNETGLTQYIRILRVDEMDKDAVLRGHFKLK